MTKTVGESGIGNSIEPVQLVWVDLMKAIALIWIFLNHVIENIFGYPAISNPTAEWPPLAERLNQLRPLQGYGLWDIPVNLLRYFGWFGDQGSEPPLLRGAGGLKKVELFLIVSGFGLTWGLLQRSSGRSPLSGRSTDC